MWRVLSNVVYTAAQIEQGELPLKRRQMLRLLAGAGAVLWTPTSGTLLEAALPVRQEPVDAPPLLPLFPLPLVLFPETNLPLHIFEPRYKEMIQECLDRDWEFGILLDEEGSFRDVGCTAAISEVLTRYPDGRMNILVRGRSRFRVEMFDEERSYLRGQVQFMEDSAAGPTDLALSQRGIGLYTRLNELAQLENEAFHTPAPVATDTQLSYRMMAGVLAPPAWKQDLLESRSEAERLVRVVGYLEELVEYLESLPEQSDPGDPDA